MPIPSSIHSINKIILYPSKCNLVQPIRPPYFNVPRSIAHHFPQAGSYTIPKGASHPRLRDSKFLQPQLSSLPKVLMLTCCKAGPAARQSRYIPDTCIGAPCEVKSFTHRQTHIGVTRIAWLDRRWHTTYLRTAYPLFVLAHTRGCS